MSGRPSVSLVLPACDEAENIDQVLTQARAALEALTKEFEIIVVDDGSGDDTADRVRAYPGVRLLSHPGNLGYGAALRTGLRAARLEWVFFSDADLQFDLHDLGDLLRASDGYEIVAGYRSPRRDPWKRVVLGKLWTLLVRRLFDLQVRDIDCAFKLFRREVLEAIPIESVGAFVNTEILLRARRAGFRVREVPVRHFPRDRGRPSGARPRVIWVALRELLRLRRELR